MLVRNIEEMMPPVYMPTVGEGCQRFSEIWRKPRGLFLSYPNQHRIREILPVEVGQCTKLYRLWAFEVCVQWLLQN